MEMISRIVVATSDVFVRRLSPALASFVRDRREFRVINIHHPQAELLRLIKESAPDVVIAESLPGVTEPILELGFPTVIADTDTVYPGVVSLDVDDVRVGEVAARFFIEQGYRSFGCVYLGKPYSLQRREGFKRVVHEGEGGARALADFFVSEPVLRHYLESWRDTGASLRQWLRALPKPAALFAVHDPLARMVCQAAREEGLQVPDEVAVLGANNDEIVCGLGYPPLSSVAIPWDRLGALAGQWAQLLLEGGAAPEAPILVEPSEVEHRQSTTLSAVNDPELRRALHRMRERLAGPLTIESLCAELRISRRQLERKFASLLHSSPGEMLIRMRVEVAKRLLVETDLPMALVAERSGFSDASRFSEMFRLRVGETPSRYRRKARGYGGPLPREGGEA